MFLKTRLQESSKTFVFLKEKRFRRRTRRITFRFRRDPKLFPRRFQFGSEPFVFLQKMFFCMTSMLWHRSSAKRFWISSRIGKIRNPLKKQNKFLVHVCFYIFLLNLLSSKARKIKVLNSILWANCKRYKKLNNTLKFSLFYTFQSLTKSKL